MHLPLRRLPITILIHRSSSHHSSSSSTPPNKSCWSACWSEARPAVGTTTTRRALSSDSVCLFFTLFSPIPHELQPACCASGWMCGCLQIDGWMLISRYFCRDLHACGRSLQTAEQGRRGEHCSSFTSSPLPHKEQTDWVLIAQIDSSPTVDQVYAQVRQALDKRLATAAGAAIVA